VGRTRSPRPGTPTGSGGCPGGHLVEARVELGEQAGPPDDLGQELADRAVASARSPASSVRNSCEAGPALVRQVLDLVEVLERLGEQERRGLVLVLGPQVARAVRSW
jgi:hypothetical protein